MKNKLLGGIISIGLVTGCANTSKIHIIDPKNEKYTVSQSILPKSLSLESLQDQLYKYSFSVNLTTSLDTQSLGGQSFSKNSTYSYTLSGYIKYSSTIGESGFSANFEMSENLGKFLGADNEITKLKKITYTNNYIYIDFAKPVSSLPTSKPVKKVKVPVDLKGAEINLPDTKISEITDSLPIIDSFNFSESLPFDLSTISYEKGDKFLLDTKINLTGSQVISFIGNSQYQEEDYDYQDEFTSSLDSLLTNLSFNLTNQIVFTKNSFTSLIGSLDLKYTGIHLTSKYYLATSNTKNPFAISKPESYSSIDELSIASIPSY